jgi:hypothetical protein
MVDFRMADPRTFAGCDGQAGDVGKAVGGTTSGSRVDLNGQPGGGYPAAPRTNYSALERYNKFPPIDNRRLWAIVCFLVDARSHRIFPAVRYPVEPREPSR